jgi:GSH-dependent disulfide-bond oxidoreductase
MGAWRSVSAAGVRIVAGGLGSRWRARMLRTTSAEWTPCAIASAQAASTAGSPSVRTALRMSTPERIGKVLDHDGPSSRPISIFESGAILQYLGRKTGKLYPKDERGRVEVEQWLFWQMANQGPKAGEANHFRNYAAEKLPYAIDRFANEMHRIYGVMNGRLEAREFLAGRYSIADIACVGWASRAERFGQSLGDFPNVKRWLETMLARPAVQRGLAVKVEAAFHVDMKDPAVRAVLFNQRARA